MTLMQGIAPTIYSLVWLPVILVSTLVSGISVSHAEETTMFRSERWGEFQWLSPWIETGARYQEPKDGRFTLESASFGGRWVGDLSLFRESHYIEAQVAFGTQSLILRPSRYSTENPATGYAQPAIVDAFTGVAGQWGRVRMGFLPLAFGLEEGDESQRPWLRPMILRRGLIGLRDIGIGYSVAAGGFHSDWYVHNGEGGEDLDREIWMTTRWEYRHRTSRVQWRWGASGQAGRTSPSSTLPIGSTANPLAEFDVTQGARLRFGGLYVTSDWVVGQGERGTESDRRFGFELEVFGGEVQQDTLSKRIRAVRFDLTWDPADQWGLLLRGEAFDPDSQTSADMLTEASFGIQRYMLPGSLKRSLRGLLVATKEWTESNPTERHRIEFSLKFSPEFTR